MHNYKCRSAKSPRNTRFRASDSDTIIQADRSACIARGSDPLRTSATTAMVDPSIGYLGQALCSEATMTPSTCLEHLRDLGGSFISSRLRPPLHLSSVPPLPSIKIHTAEAAEVRDMVKRQHAERRARWRVWLAPVRACLWESKEGILRSCNAAFLPPPVRGAGTPAMPLLWPRDWVDRVEGLFVGVRNFGCTSTAPAPPMAAAQIRSQALVNETGLRVDYQNSEGLIPSG
jgi:hypothetical protein